MMGEDLTRQDAAETETSDSVLEWVISGLVALVAVGGVIAVATALLLFFPGSNGLDAAEVQEILEEDPAVTVTTVEVPATEAPVPTTASVGAAPTTVPAETVPVSVLATEIEVPTERFIAYRVVRGDTLSLIGRAYGVDWRRLAVINQLPDPNFLSIGLVLQVPVVDEVGGLAAFTDTSLIVLNPTFDALAEAYGVPAELLKAVLWVQTEWGTDPEADGFVVMSEEAITLVEDVTGQVLDLGDPEQAIEAAAAHLGDLLAQAEGDASAAAAGFFEGVASTRDIAWTDETVEFVAEMLRIRPAFVTT